MAVWKHEFIKKRNNKARCAYCGIEFDTTDNPEIVAAYMMGRCPEVTFDPRQAVRLTASIGENRPWIRYEANSAKDDDSYYRDYINKNGDLCYCDGEMCLVHPWLHPEQHPDEVLMTNPDSTIPYFIIPMKQFLADFGEENGKEALELLYEDYVPKPPLKERIAGCWYVPDWDGPGNYDINAVPETYKAAG